MLGPVLKMVASSPVLWIASHPFKLGGAIDSGLHHIHPN